MRTTVIVPTFDEGPNVAPLLARMDAALAGLDADVLFVDDGTDDLPEQVALAGARTRVPVGVLRRTEAQGGLGGAVVEGMRRAAGSELFVVCDGDLQHPPELIPELVAAAHAAPVVVATRYVPGGTATGLGGGVRRAVSRLSGGLSRAVLPGRVRRCSDPMSGFFAVRRDVLDLDALRPRGFKILLEILVRSRPTGIREIPFDFGERAAGHSHANVLQGLRFLAQLVSLRAASSPTAARILRFGLVGASGVLPNLLALWAFERSGMHYWLAAVLAVQISIAWNFAGAELFVWRRQPRSMSLRRRAAWFLAVGETDLLRLPFVVLLVEFTGVSTTLATVVTLVAAFVLRFLFADRVAYRPRVAVAAAVLPATALPVTGLPVTDTVLAEPAS